MLVNGRLLSRLDRQRASVLSLRLFGAVKEPRLHVRGLRDEILCAAAADWGMEDPGDVVSC